MEIGILLTGISTALGIAKNVKDAHEALNSAELKSQMAEVISTLADAKIALSEQQTEIAAKDKAFAELRETLNVIEDTVEHDGMRYRKNEEGKPTGRPYCEPCLLDDGIAILTQRSNESGRPQKCPRCQRLFHVTNFG